MSNNTEALKDRGMIFNAEMVRAILDGRKTQTRRIVSPQPTPDQGMVNAAYCGHSHLWLRNGTCRIDDPTYEWKCPHGQPGDRLWVRETFQGPLFDCDQMDSYAKDSAPFEKPESCQYAADGGPRPEYQDMDGNLRYGWRPSIHMPRWASRITLEITGVRAERLSDISEEDARAEGVSQLRGRFWKHYQPSCTQHQLNARGSFLTLWDSIYGDDAWQSNPWVWVIEFKRVETSND